MKGFLYMVGYVAVMLLVGCQSEGNAQGDGVNDVSEVNAQNENVDNDPVAENDSPLLTGDGLAEITVERLRDSEQLTFDEEESVEAFEAIFAHAVQSMADYDIIEPEYQVHITYDNGDEQSLNLWITKEEQEILLSRASTTQTIYIVETEFTTQVRGMVKELLN
ncbi:hypothetical protein FLK61_23995 [Paenalkalicoccus suaedae]|uniref:YhfM-like domain-containing protein n=1 Tax=Paenalkalicoccus suaedae TaxID=2592382 RepID=A0A859FAQ4_9BACI|nr:hypothetical protein [Paenalkalicoccus suaedae]QKS69852.1 hypothetical protein FLK61_23995 [Paenalkalicoccus suaedae]